jgi:hypothetical protein
MHEFELNHGKIGCRTPYKNVDLATAAQSWFCRWTPFVLQKLAPRHDDTYWKTAEPEGFLQKTSPSHPIVFVCHPRRCISSNGWRAPAALNPSAQLPSIAIPNAKTLLRRSPAAPCSTAASPSPTPSRSSQRRPRLAAPCSPASSAPATSLPGPGPPHLRFIRPGPQARAPGQQLAPATLRASGWEAVFRSPLHRMTGGSFPGLPPLMAMAPPLRGLAPPAPRRGRPQQRSSSPRMSDTREERCQTTGFLIR